MTLRIRRLAPTDDRSQFASGNPDVDRFFQRFAGQNQFRHHIGVTYIAIAAEVIVGFVTVTASEIEIDALPDARRRQLPRYPLPVLRVARLAVAEQAQGRGIGKALLRFALDLARKTAELGRLHWRCRRRQARSTGVLSQVWLRALRLTGRGVAGSTGAHPAVSAVVRDSSASSLAHQVIGIFRPSMA